MSARTAMRNGPRVLLLDCETAPIIGHLWGIWDQNVGLNQIKRDWHLLSWAAKWLDDPADKVMYMDQSGAANIEDDSKLLRGIWKLLDEADVVITQNGVSFDVRKLNARFIMNGMQPPSPWKNIDTKLIAAKKFAFTSNKLEYLTDKLNRKYKKLKHKKFEGFELWRECLAGNPKAWAEMKKYNIHDVLALEELYHKLAPWDSGAPKFAWYRDGEGPSCNCGSTEFVKRGYAFTSVGKFQRYKCTECGAWTRDSVNLFSPKKRASLRSRV